MNKEKLTSSTLDALLYLSRLSPDSINMQVLKEQVDQIVEYFDILSQFDEGTKTELTTERTVEDLREDVVVKGLEIADLKKMTPEFMDGYFRVPKVLGEGA